MTKDVSFQLDPKGGEDILQNMVAPLIEQSGKAILQRAQSMASSMSSNPPEITLSTSVGTIRRGTRAIATITSKGKDAHQDYIGHQALFKSKDAGRVN